MLPYTFLFITQSVTPFSVTISILRRVSQTIVITVT
jgi:hypothetical protein